MGDSGRDEGPPLSHFPCLSLPLLHVDQPEQRCTADCGYCGWCDSSVQAEPPTEQEDYFTYLSYCLNKPPKEKKKKGRQGRSAESRMRSQKSRDNWRTMVRQGIIQEERDPVCKECFGDELMEDGRSGDVVCLTCGVVQSSQGLGFDCCVPVKVKPSKPYQPLVHFRQRQAQLVNRDPRIQKKTWKKLEREILSRNFPEEELKILGKKKLSHILIEMKMPRRLSANWIQVRLRLGLEPSPPTPENADLLWKRMNGRYFCLTNAFFHTLKKRDDLSHSKNLSRKNIINVNYSFLQLLRLENPDFLSLFGIFFPQLSSKEQPGRNNKRWKILMEYCEKNYKNYSCPKTNEPFYFNWKFIPLTSLEIMEHCTFFD